ncbi:hypothetical protein F2Q69_00012527 [Brassica cretica]|uniref:Uncharacterized protein n=1 Tax=Brassica cretica TaxID=69181 RepID=A0A8S9QSV0_BRACR|nr:hypothetical protein F2Q69_00012527 [Brassica cretica]
MSMNAHRSTNQDEDRSTEYSRNRSTSSAESTAECSAVRIITHEEFAEKHPHPPFPFYVKIDQPHEPAIDRQRETDIDRPPHLPSINWHLSPTERDYYLLIVDEATEGRVLRKRKEKIPKLLKREANEKEMDGFTKRVLRIPVEKQFDELGNDIGYIAACHCGAEYETEYLESIDTQTITSIDSNESTMTDERYPTSLDGMQPVDHSTLPDQYYPDYAFQQPNKNGRDDYSIGSWADSGFHESFAVETVILSSNEDPTEEYDEDYWKERATEIAMHDERYSTHSFNNTPPPSIDDIYSASVDTHPHPAKQLSESIDTTHGTSIDIKAAALEEEKGNIPIPNRDQDGHARAMDGRILQVSREDIADIL